MAGAQISLITEAARQALLAEVRKLGDDVDAHIAGGLDKHDAHTILNHPFLDSHGDVISSKTLRIGFKLSNGASAYVLIPAIPL